MLKNHLLSALPLVLLPKTSSVILASGVPGRIPQGEIEDLWSLGVRKSGSSGEKRELLQEREGSSGQPSSTSQAF